MATRLKINLASRARKYRALAIARLIKNMLERVYRMLRCIVARASGDD